MKDHCKAENELYLNSLKNFIDARASLVIAAVLVGKKSMPIEQTAAVKKTESDLIKDSNNLNECLIGKLLANA